MQQELVLAIRISVVIPSQSPLRYQMTLGPQSAIYRQLPLTCLRSNGVYVCGQPPTYQEYHHIIFRRSWSNSHEIVPNLRRKKYWGDIFVLLSLLLIFNGLKLIKCRAGRRVVGIRTLLDVPFLPPRHSCVFLEVFVLHIFQPGPRVTCERHTSHWVWEAELLSHFSPKAVILCSSAREWWEEQWHSALERKGDFEYNMYQCLEKNTERWILGCIIRKSCKVLDLGRPGFFHNQMEWKPTPNIACLAPWNCRAPEK